MEPIYGLTNSTIIHNAPSVGATEPFHAVSDKYSFVPTSAAVNALRDSGWHPVMVSEVRAREEHKGFQKHLIRFTRSDLIVNGHRMDLLLYNSHDRGSAFKLIGGVFRFVCSNGMVVGDKMAEFSHRHMGFSFDEFVKSAKVVHSHLGNVAGVIEDWQAINLTPDEKGVFAMAAHEAVYDDPQSAPVEPWRLLIPKRRADDKCDLWTTFNTIQENVIRGGMHGKTATGKLRRTRPVKSIDKDRKLNQALWTLTQKMAELKSA